MARDECQKVAFLKRPAEVRTAAERLWMEMRTMR